MAFEITHSRLKRAGLDYWEHLKVIEHESLDSFWKTMPAGAEFLLFTKKAAQTHFEVKYTPGMYLIFGKETMGLPDDLVQRFPTHTVRIPMRDARVRSLNLSNAASIVVYEAIRQIEY